MDEDKQQELLNDMVEDGFSNCCGAKVILDFCMDCKEHCEIVIEE